MDQKMLSAASLPFFGIPRLFPYIRKYRKTLLIMLICGLGGTGVDLALPLLQRYALNHFIARKTLDTMAVYIFRCIWPSWWAAPWPTTWPARAPCPRRSG